MSSSFPKRIWFVVLLVLIVAGGIIFRLFNLQVVAARHYENKAENQYVSNNGIFSRGTIYLTRKDGTLISGATIANGFKLALDPSQIKNPEALYVKLSDFLAINKETFLMRASKAKDTYEEVANRLTEEQAAAIKKLNEPGLTLFPENWRFYPGGHLASQVIGFLGYKGDTFTGRYGLERQYNSILGGSDDNPNINFFAEVFSNMSNTVVKDNVKRGSIVTTIEPLVQEALEKKLAQIKTDWQSDQVGGIIINPQNGEIYAMANLPDFNPNEYGSVENQAVFGNPLVESVFEIGSVVKTLTVSSGIDAGVITPTTTYYDKGYIILNTERINDSDHIAHGVTSIQEVLNKSLNVGAVFVMQKLGKEAFKNYMMKFGLTEKTNIDLPGEVKNLVSNLSSPRELEYATASFGQGIAITPVSAVRAFSAITNGGHLITPHVVRQIMYDDGTIETPVYPLGTQVISKETSETMARVMTKVVDTGLLGGTLKLPHYSVGAKTGTAQIAKPNGGGYFEDKYLHTMYGYAPAYDPQFLIFLYNMNPKNGSVFSNKTLGKPLMDTMDFLLTYYNVPTDR